MFYNSALKNDTQRINAAPLQRYEHNGSIGLRWNIITEPPPPEIYTCDVIYCEPPFPAGIKVFDQRAGEETKDYAYFASAFARVWATFNVPKYAIVNKRLLSYLPPPDNIVPVKLNKARESLAIWGGPVPGANTNLGVCLALGRVFSRVGDITCGYGGQLIAFAQAKAGNTFVATDYDPHCIGALKIMVESCQS